jgi:hypothetical protein
MASLASHAACGWTHCVAAPSFGPKALLRACRPRARSRPSTRDHAPRARADTGSVGLDHRELRHQRRHFIDDAVARGDFEGLERDGRRPGMTRICKAMAEGADLFGFRRPAPHTWARATSTPSCLRPPVGRLAMWPGPPGDSIRLKRPGPREELSATATQAGVQRRAIPVRWRNGFAQKIG